MSCIPSPESPAEGLAGSGSEVGALGRIDVESGILVEHEDVSAVLGQLLHGLLGFLVDGGHQLLLLLLKFGLHGLLELLDTLLDVGELFFLSLTDSLGPGVELLLILLHLAVELIGHRLIGLACFLAGGVHRCTGLVGLGHQLHQFGEIDVGELLLGKSRCADHCQSGNQKNLFHIFKFKIVVL